MQPVFAPLLPSNGAGTTCRRAETMCFAPVLPNIGAVSGKLLRLLPSTGAVSRDMARLLGNKRTVAGDTGANPRESAPTPAARESMQTRTVRVPGKIVRLQGIMGVKQGSFGPKSGNTGTAARGADLA
ncbi:MAG TPA: hypothetical protein VGG02_12905 [Chthoniobacterales bacterium]